MKHSHNVVKASVINLRADLGESDEDEIEYEGIVEDFIINLECSSENLTLISQIAEKEFKSIYKHKKIHDFKIEHIGPLDSFHLIVV